MSTYRFGIVVSKFNSVYTEALLASACKELEEHQRDVVKVPGAFEIPLQVKRLANTGKYDALIALGLVWKGETRHDEEILRSTSDALMRIGLEKNVPVVHGVLSVNTEEQAQARTQGGEMDRGISAARTALELAKISEIKEE